MNSIDAVLLNAIKSDLAAVGRVSENIANVNTPGFRASSTQKISKSKFAALVVNKAQLSASEFLKNSRSHIDGALIKTGKANDIAATDGFYIRLQDKNSVVDIPSVSVVTDPDGVVVDQQGRRLLDSSSAVIRLSGPLKVGKHDSLIGADGERVQLLVVSASGNPVSAGSEAHIKSGFLRASNVNSANQMISLMEISKHLESTQRAFKALEGIQSLGINQLGK